MVQKEWDQASRICGEEKLKPEFILIEKGKTWVGLYWRFKWMTVADKIDTKIVCIKLYGTGKVQLCKNENKTQ